MIAERRLVFVINPIAGTNPKNDLEAYLSDQARAAGIPHMVMHSNKHTTSATIQSVAMEFAATDIIACGGDGTVNMTAEAAEHCHATLGIVPCGSGNGLAYTAQISTKPALAWDTILHGKAIPIDTFTVNRSYACMLAGVGLDAAVAESFSHQARRGLATYTTQTLIEFFKARPYQFKVSLPEMDFYTDAYFITVANSNQFGNNVTIAPQASLSDGLLDVVIVQNMPKTNMPFAVWNQIKGNNKLMVLAENILKQNILYFQTPSITIENQKHAPLHIDGDPATSDDLLHFSINEASVKLLVPPLAKM